MNIITAIGISVSGITARLVVFPSESVNKMQTHLNKNIQMNSDHISSDAIINRKLRLFEMGNKIKFMVEAICFSPPTRLNHHLQAIDHHLYWHLQVRS